MYTLPCMSFREHLNMYANSQFAAINFTELIANHQVYDDMLTTIPKIKGHFRHYLQSLQETGFITLIYPAEGGNQGLRRPEKMFLNNTNLHYAINGEINTAIDIGSVRELFFIQAVSNAGENLFYSKQGDYEVANYVFEIGGRNKTRQQIKGLDNGFVVKDDSLVSRQREIPLVLFGFLY